MESQNNGMKLREKLQLTFSGTKRKLRQGAGRGRPSSYLIHCSVTKLETPDLGTVRTRLYAQGLGGAG